MSLTLAKLWAEAQKGSQRVLAANGDEVLVPDRLFAEYTCDEIREAARLAGLRRVRGHGGLFVVTVPKDGIRGSIRDRRRR